MDTVTTEGLLRVDDQPDRRIFDVCIEQLEYGTRVTVWLDGPAGHELSQFAAPLGSLRVPQAVELQVAGASKPELRHVYVMQEMGHFVLVANGTRGFRDPEPRGYWPCQT